MRTLAEEAALEWARANAKLFEERPTEFGEAVAQVARAALSDPSNCSRPDNHSVDAGVLR